MGTVVHNRPLAKCHLTAVVHLISEWDTLPPMCTPPAKLYKYFATTRSGIFDNWLIRFTQPDALNDPFEMKPHIAGFGSPEDELAAATDRWEEHARERYAELVEQYGNRVSFADFRARIEKDRASMIQKAIAELPKHHTEMAVTINKLLNDNVGVLSLCSHPDSLLMWPHYGDSHRGFVVEFDTSSPFFRQERPPEHIDTSEEEAGHFAEEYGRLRAVTYSSERPSVAATKLSFDSLLTKGLDWKYEDEWRMLMPLQYADENEASDDLGFPICLFKIPPSAITKVIVGCAAAPELIARALSIRDRVDTRHVSIEKARVDERHFQLHFDQFEC